MAPKKSKRERSIQKKPGKPRPGAAAANKAAILKALAHPARISMFESLSEGEKTAGRLAEELGAKEANTSRHLALMRNAGLLGARKEGLHVYYRIKLPCLLSMLSCLNEGVCCIADEHSRAAMSLREMKA